MLEKVSGSNILATPLWSNIEKDSMMATAA